MTYTVLDFTGPHAKYHLSDPDGWQHRGPRWPVDQAYGDHRASDASRKRASRRKRKTDGTHDQRSRNGRTASDALP